MWKISEQTFLINRGGQLFPNPLFCVILNLEYIFYAA